MGVEIVENQSDALGLRIGSRDLLTKLRELALGAPLRDLPKPSSRQRLDRRKQRTRAKLFVFIVLFLNLAFAHRSRQQDLANQKARSFIKAQHGIGGIIGQRIQRQDPFEMRQKGSVNTTNAPGVFKVRF